MVDHIDNFETGLSARTKINQLIDDVAAIPDQISDSVAVVADSVADLSADVAATTVCAADITVSLDPGVTLGKYSNGDTIPAQGKTFEEVLNLIAIKDIAPTYTIPTHVLTKSATTQAEVGASYTNNLTATFTQNDAGSLTAIRIQKNGSDMTPNGSSSPFLKTDTYYGDQLRRFDTCDYVHRQRD